MANKFREKPIEEQPVQPKPEEQVAKPAPEPEPTASNDVAEEPESTHNSKTAKAVAKAPN